MLKNFFLLNFQFAIHIISFLFYFAGFWLHLDSWKIDRKKTSFFYRGIGFLLLAVGIFLQVTPFNILYVKEIVSVIDILGLLIIASSLISEPLARKPKKILISLLPLNIFLLLRYSFSFIPFILSLIISYQYKLKADKGLERQLKPLQYSFFFLSLVKFYDGLVLSGIFEKNIIFDLYFSQYKIFWVLIYLIKLVSIIILARWIWGYLRFRPQAQMFLLTAGSIFSIFVSVTVIFTFLLFINLENDTLSHLKTDVNIFHYSLESLQTEALAYSLSLSSNNDIIKAVNEDDTKTAYEKMVESNIAPSVAFIKIVNSSGKVIADSSSLDKNGENIFNYSTVKSALSGNRLSTLVSKQTSIFPQIEIQAATPIISDKKVTGAVLVGYNIDDAFVDGIKQATGLDVSILADTRRSATTFFAPDGKTRYTGTIESNKKIKEAVLIKGESYQGQISVINKSYYGVYSPIKTYGDKIIGMVFVGKSQNNLIETAKRSFDITFAASMILMVIALIPSYYISKYLIENIEA